MWLCGARAGSERGVATQGEASTFNARGGAWGNAEQSGSRIGPMDWGNHRRTDGTPETKVVFSWTVRLPIILPTTTESGV